MMYLVSACHSSLTTSSLDYTHTPHPHHPHHNDEDDEDDEDEDED